MEKFKGFLIDLITGTGGVLVAVLASALSLVGFSKVVIKWMEIRQENKLLKNCIHKPDEMREALRTLGEYKSTLSADVIKKQSIAEMKKVE